MHWINFHIKHTAASQFSIIHLAVWARRKDFRVLVHSGGVSCGPTDRVGFVVHR